MTVRQVKKEYNVIKNKGGNYAALEESRKEVLEQIPQEPNTEEALAFYQSTYGYTEDLRVVIQDLRLRIKVTLGFLLYVFIYGCQRFGQERLFFRALWLRS